MSLMAKIDWDKNPLLPVISQDSQSNEVLILAYMNKEALELTLSSGFAHYFSRSKQRIWKKGETSGHTQKVHDVLLDCDEDTILLKVTQEGVACHTGRSSCFFQSLKDEKIISETVIDTSLTYSIVDRVFHTIESRKNSDPTSSYAAKLFDKGDTAILKKVIEEAGELALAIKDKDEQEAIYEAADLLFHTLVALSYMNISPDRVKQELARREGLSGIEEKNGRTS
jgi:phosphoribosyl-AMP cyclohydrolase / phosphoribosyl-ATP pyrophosphohydrolase